MEFIAKNVELTYKNSRPGTGQYEGRTFYNIGFSDGTQGFEASVDDQIYNKVKIRDFYDVKMDIGSKFNRVVDMQPVNKK